MTFTELSVDELKDEASLLTNAVFAPSDANRVAGHAYLSRLKLRVSDRDAAVSVQSATEQIGSDPRMGAHSSEESLWHAGEDPLADAHSAREQGRRRYADQRVFLGPEYPGRHLVMYPDASHGAQSQYTEEFLELSGQIVMRKSHCELGATIPIGPA